MRIQPNGAAPAATQEPGIDISVSHHRRGQRVADGVLECRAKRPGNKIVKIELALEIVLLEEIGRNETEDALTPRDFLHRDIKAACSQQREGDPIARS